MNPSARTPKLLLRRVFGSEAGASAYGNDHMKSYSTGETPSSTGVSKSK
ncbi:MAG: hypothetical protein H6577_16705 [Lewinellaceae bacterium]|nr:hypothetical protein [Lewinellaceae bacterium]